MRKYVGFGLIVVLLVALIAGCAPAAPTMPAAPKVPGVPAVPAAPVAPKAPAPRAKETVRLVSSTFGSTGNLICIGYSLMAEKYSPWLRAEVVPTRGVLEAAYVMLEGKGVLAQTNAEYFPLIVAGEKGFKALGPRKDLRLVQPMYTSAVHAIVLGASPITAFTFDQLKGKTVVTREIGTIGQEICLALLQAIGLDPKKDVKMLYMGVGDAYSALLAGQADISIQSHGMPYPYVEETFVTKPCRLIPVASEVIEKANKMFGMTLMSGDMPVMYKGQKAPVKSAVLWGAAVSVEKIADDIIYELVRCWWGTDDRFEIHPAAKEFTTDKLPVYQKAGGIEFHRGALKYYRERGWVK